MRVLALTILAGAALAACVTCAGTGQPVRGMMRATWAPPDGAKQEVPFSFESEAVDHSHGMMFTTLGRGGPHFRGPYVRIEASTEGHLVTVVYDAFSGPEWDIWEHDSEGHWVSTAVSYGDFAHFYTGRVVASLRSEGGLAMRCQIRLSQPLGGLLKGGSGACQVTDGGRLDLEF